MSEETAWEWEMDSLESRCLELVGRTIRNLVEFWIWSDGKLPKILREKIWRQSPRWLWSNVMRDVFFREEEMEAVTGDIDTIRWGGRVSKKRRTGMMRVQDWYRRTKGSFVCMWVRRYDVKEIGLCLHCFYRMRYRYGDEVELKYVTYHVRVWRHSIEGVLLDKDNWCNSCFLATTVEIYTPFECSRKLHGRSISGNERFRDGKEPELDSGQSTPELHFSDCEEEERNTE